MVGSLPNSAQQLPSREETQGRGSPSTRGSQLSARSVGWTTMVDETPQAAPASTKLARAALIAACVGWLTPPIGLLAVAWAMFVAIVICLTNRRDGRRVPTAAYATIVVSILFACLLRGGP